MLGLCLRYTRNRDEAEDLLQDGFVKIFKNLDQYTGPGSFEGWIRKIMVNTVLESFRKKKLRFSGEDIQELENDPATEADALNRIGLKDLLALVQGLPPGYQLVFNLYAIEGYPHKEIATMLDISEGTSKSQLARARMLLQDKIKQQEITPTTREDGQ